MQIKTTVSYHCTPVRMAKISKTDHAKYSAGCIATELYYTVCGNVKWYNNLGEKLGGFFKMLKNMIYPFRFWVFTQDKRNIHPLKNLYCVRSTTIYDSQKVQKTQMSFN